MAPVRKKRNYCRARIPTISVKVVKCNGASKVRKIPLTCNRPALTSAKKREAEWPNLRLDQQPPPSESLPPCEPHGYDNETDIIANRCAQENSQATSYSTRKRREETAWENSRQKLQEAFVSQQFLPNSTICTACEDFGRRLPNMAVCRCKDCGWKQVFCLSCATSIHSDRNLFHVLEIWKDGAFIPLFPNTKILTPPGHGSCGTIYDIREIIFLDLQGRQHIKKVQFCSCQSDAEALVSMGFWPGTIERPRVAFDLQLMDLFSQLLFECHCSLDKLCAMISLWRHPLLPVYVQHIYPVLNSSSFDEFRFFKDSLGIQKDDCVLCPRPGDDGPLIEIIDACFGFVRKKSAGTSFSCPRFETRMFADQNDVDNFVLKHSKEIKKSENPCNQYKAGEITDSIRSKGKNAKYDEKAVLGRICRHGHPKGFISLKHGERIAYAVYELKRMVEPYKSSPEVKLKCMYDIACILDVHLQNNKDYGLEDIFDKIQFGIPIFHSYVHKSRCQVLYSPRRCDGLGLTDGEGIERLWSYLRKFSYMTKEMKSNRRTDTLTEALLHYARRMLNNQVSQENEDDWRCDYASLLWNHFLLRNSLASSEIVDEKEGSKSIISSLKRSDMKLKLIEKKRNVKTRWKVNDLSFINAMRLAEKRKSVVFLEQLHSMAVERQMQILLKEKYSHGQKQAIRLSRKLSKHTKRMKEFISKYNARYRSFVLEPEPEYMVQVWHKHRPGEDTEESEDSSSS
eukprot:gene7287-12983_t